MVRCFKSAPWLGAMALLFIPASLPAAVLSIGHRGNSLFAPENTVSAFVACSNKADLVEFDVQVSSDGALVIMHDGTVDRTTDGTGNVSALTLAQLKALDAGLWFSTNFIGERIPTLEEAITNILPYATPLIEHKAGSASAYVPELRRLNALTNVLLQSFTWSFLSDVRALEPAIPLCALSSSTLTAALLTNAMNTGARTVAWEKSKVTAAEVSLVHSVGLKLFVWTVDSPTEIQSFIDLGVDGIISDDPAMVKGIRDPANEAPVAVNDSYAAAADTLLTVSAPGVLANDRDVDADTLTAVGVSQPGHGSVTLNPNGGFSYQPALNYTGADSFSYKANDGPLDSAVATVTITVSPITNLGDRLIAYWKMDDGLTNAFTTNVTDSKGTNAGTLTRNDGVSHWFGESVAKLGGCLKLEGLNAYVTLLQTPDLNINTNELTFSAWIRLMNLPSQLATSYGAIFDSTSDCYVLYLDKGNKELRFKITDVNTHPARPGIPEAALQTNQWLHVAATFNGGAFPAAGQAVIYLNGQLADSHIGSDNTPGSGLTANVKTGQVAAMGREGPTGGNYFTGYVDDIALWTRALTAAEIARIFQGGQLGQSVGELTRQATTLIQFVSIQTSSSGSNLEIRFQNLGAWSSFQLLRATNFAGPFLVVPGLTPTALGGGQYRFDYPLTVTGPEYFRIAGD